MFGWFAPKAPVSTGEKTWTEYRMRWLAGKLGLDRLIACQVILPEHRVFPDPYHATADGARRVFDRLCGFMQIDPSRFEFEIVPDDVIPHAAGLYFQEEQPRILVAHSQLYDPERLVSTIAHELAHDILLGGGLITVDEEDHEELTDLLPVYLGLGIFAANSPVRDRSLTSLGTSYFKVNQQGYLSSRMIGYALALFAYARAERDPGWVRYLRPDAAGPMQQGLRYLFKTGDTLFRPETACEPVVPPTEDEVIERLTSGSPTVQAMTLHEVTLLDVPPIGLVPKLTSVLFHRDTDLRVEAARTLSIYGRAAVSAVPSLLQCLLSSSASVRGTAAAALHAIGGPPDQVVPELTRVLKDPEAWVSDWAAVGLSSFGKSAIAAIPALIDAISRREIDCHRCDDLAAAVIAIDPPPEIIQDELNRLEADIRNRVVRSLRLARMRRAVDRATAGKTDPA